MDKAYWMKLIKAFLWPPVALMIVLIPVASVALVLSMLRLGTEHPVSIAAYVLSAYTLGIWCVRIPRLIAFGKRLKHENRLLHRLSTDVHWRVTVTLIGAFLWNAAYAALQLGLGIYHASAWYDSMAVYSLSLAVMRVVLWRHTRRHDAGERMRAELIRYRNCGWVFLIMNLALTAMILMLIFEQRVIRHHEITTIAMAAYTFTAFTTAIVNVVRYRRYHSPVYSASKAISLAAACVSMLTLSATMLTTFGDGTTDAAFRTLMLALIGLAVSAFVITMALCMIINGNRQLKQQNNHEVHTHEA